MCSTVMVSCILCAMRWPPWSVVCSLTPYPLTPMAKARLFKNPQDERAAFDIFSGLVTALLFKRKLDASDVVASLETLIKNIKENNPDVFTT